MFPHLQDLRVAFPVQFVTFGCMRDEAMNSWARATHRVARLEDVRSALILDEENPDRAELLAELDFLIAQERVLQRKFLWVASAPSPLED